MRWPTATSPSWPLNTPQVGASMLMLLARVEGSEDHRVYVSVNHHIFPNQPNDSFPLFRAVQQHAAACTYAGTQHAAQSVADTAPTLYPRFGGDCYSRWWGIGIFGGSLFSGNPDTTITTHDDSDRAAGGEGRSRVADVAKGCDRGRFWSRGRVFVRVRRCRRCQGLYLWCFANVPDIVRPGTRKISPHHYGSTCTLNNIPPTPNYG